MASPGTHDFEIFHADIHNTSRGFCLGMALFLLVNGNALDGFDDAVPFPVTLNAPLLTVDSITRCLQVFAFYDCKLNMEQTSPSVAFAFNSVQSVLQRTDQNFASVVVCNFGLFYERNCCDKGFDCAGKFAYLI